MTQSCARWRVPLRQSLDALAEIKGIGANKLEKFGTAFLQAIKGSA